MQIHVDQQSNIGILSVLLQHGRDSMIMSAGSYHSAAILNRDSLFKETNAYLASLSDAEQSSIWQAYIRANELLSDDQMRTSYSIRSELEKVVNSIYEIVTYASVKRFVTREGMVIPRDVPDRFEEYGDKGRNYRNRTYIREDYIDLMVLALALRFMIPIWGVYIQDVSSINGNGYKESEAVKLIEQAGLNQWPPFERMLEYTAASVDKTINLSSIMAGLSTEEIPRHLMAMALVRKISTGPLNTINERESLARILFNYVTGTQDRMDGRFRTQTGQVVPKKSHITSKNEDDNSSVWDDYGQTQEITEGDRQLIEVFTQNVPEIIRRADPTLELSRAQQCISVCSKDVDREIHPFQKALIFWTIRSISPEARDLLSRASLLTLTGVAQALLDHWGFYELALLIGAELYENPDDGMYFVSDPRRKLSNQQIETLNRQYPFYRQETKRVEPGKRTNVAIVAIDMVVQMTAGTLWKPHAPRDIIARYPHIAQVGYMAPPGDMRRQLADMIIHVNNLLIGGQQ